MSQTNIEKKVSYYERIIAEGKKSPHSSKYVDVCTALEKLVTLSKILNKADAMMSPEAFEELNRNYRDVQKACRDYLEAEKEFSPFEKSRKSIIQDISHVIDKDMGVLEKCDPMEPGTLAEIISKSRSHSIVLKGDDIKTVGGALSSRIPLKTPTGKRGFFTPKSIYNQDKQWNEMIDKHMNLLGALSPTYKTNMERLKSEANVIDVFYKYCPPLPVEQYIAHTKNEEMVERQVLGVACLLGIGTDERTARIFLKEKKVKRALFDFIADMSGLANTYNIMKVAGIKKDSNLSSRNCAMTDVANLLGCGNLLAHSVPMKIVVDGKEVEGVFMETAEGTDLSRLKEEDPILEADFDSFEGSDGLNQIADLQVLDFICGNIDRHICNIVYQFAENNGKIVFTGIKGIDNDCSFGLVDTTVGKKAQQLVLPEKMQFITASMCSKLQNITKDALDLILAPHELSDEEKDAVWDRVERLNTAIKKKWVEVVPNDYWKNNKFIQTRAKEGNYFEKIKSIANSCERSLYNESQRGHRDVRYMQDRRAANMALFGKTDAIAALREKMNNAKAFFYNTSEYNLMKNSFENIEKLTEEIRKEYKEAKDIPEIKTIILENAYEELAQKAFRYIELKKLVPSTERGQKRVELAQYLLNFANDTLEEMTMNPEMETQASKEQPMEINEPEDNIEL